MDKRTFLCIFLQHRRLWGANPNLRNLITALRWFKRSKKGLLTNTDAIFSQDVAEGAEDRGTADYGITRARTGPSTGADGRRKLLRKPHWGVGVQWLGVGRRFGSGIRLRIKALGDAEVTSILIHTLHVTAARTGHRAALIHICRRNTVCNAAHSLGWITLNKHILILVLPLFCTFILCSLIQNTVQGWNVEEQRNIWPQSL